MTWSPAWSSGTPYTAASTTSGCRLSAASIGRGREVLAVDADPVGVAPGEVQVSVVVEVPEVAGPVPAEAERPLVRLGVVVVALERPGAGGVDDLADALVGVERAGRSSSKRARGRSFPSSSTTLTVGPTCPSAPARSSASRSTATPPSVAPNASMTSTPKRRDERFDDLRRALVAERDPQRVVGVVGQLRRREEVRQRLAGVVEIRRAVAADVGQPPGGAEPAAQARPTRPYTIDGAQPTISAFEWKSGMHT